MATDGVWGEYIPIDQRPTSTATAASRNPKSQLDKDTFLTLLITQMQYQDPLNPMDDKQFLAQMAQFTSLEQMQNLNTTISQTASYDYIGRWVSGMTADESTGTTKPFDGVVQSITVENGIAYVNMGEDVRYKADDVIEVGPIMSSADNSINQNTFDSKYMAMIGKYVQALVIQDGKAVGYVEGEVTAVDFTTGQPIVMVGNQAVYPSEILAVSTDKAIIGREMAVQDLTGEQTAKGLIEDLVIEGDKVYVVVDGEKAEVGKIDQLMDALKYVGQEVKTLTVSGTATELFVRGGVLFFKVGDEEVKYSDIVRKFDKPEDEEKEDDETDESVAV